MKCLRKYYLIYGFILIILSILLLFKYLPNAIVSIITSNEHFLDLISLVWPILGLSVAFEFLRKKIDVWGWGGILFFIFILYCGIYYLLLVLISLFNFSISFGFVIDFILNISICSIAWLAYFLYYD
ncbi:MAG: hypothetical protein ACFE8E_10390 [Candidatus Hodarchaeota archaeon]